MTKNENEYKKYIESLPKKRMGAGIIIRNKEKKILMLKPSYKETLEIPGGVVEKNESPYQACKREVKEELGINIEVEKLLCVDYNSAKEILTESLMFIFYGGEIEEDKIKIDNNEIVAFDFLSLTEIKEKTEPQLYKRIEKSILALEANQTYYLENQMRINDKS